MILEEETFEAFNHYPSELKHGSHKLILAACLDCGKTRAVEKRQYRELCKACADKANLNRLGATNTEEHNIKISAARKGKYIGKKNPNWSGGKELARKRHSASRRQLGYSPLLPLGIGEVGHHITNEYVIGIPKEVHNNIGGNREKHRAKVLEWLKVNDKRKYSLVLLVLKP